MDEEKEREPWFEEEVDRQAVRIARATGFTALSVVFLALAVFLGAVLGDVEVSKSARCGLSLAGGICAVTAILFALGLGRRME